MEEKTENYVLPTNDMVFKRIFGYEGNEDLCMDLVSSIIGEKIKELEIKNPYMYRDYTNDKEEVLDIKALLDNNTLCDIEVQMTNYHDIDKRLLDYWAKMYRTESQKGKRNYNHMKRTIIILIANFNVDNLEGYSEYQTKFKIMEEKLKIVLTDVFELDIIELSKVKKAIENNTFEGFGNLKEWMDFLINPEMVMSMRDMKELDEKIQKAYEEWQKLNENEEERDLAEARYTRLAREKYALEYEYNDGLKKGKLSEKMEIAKKMKKAQKSIEEIIEFTGLTKEEIEKL